MLFSGLVWVGKKIFKCWTACLTEELSQHAIVCLRGSGDRTQDA